VNQKLSRSGEHVAVGHEDQLHQAAAEVRPVDPLARVGEQNLMYHISHVIVNIGRCSATSAIEMKRVI
jgi:hypothetical protein